MPTSTEILKLNERLAEQVEAEARANPQSPYVGKFVGIANGRVVAIADDEDEVDRMLDEIEPDPRRVFIVDTNRDPNQIEYFWEMP
ncbi:MAG: hypothetical protein K8T89_02805 [Planctomycetes bacterium]|nr:hypothetical protein [Planctomycetota bacterium]